MMTASRGKAWLVAGAAAAGSAAAALFNRARTRRAEVDTPPVGKFVTVSGVRAHCQAIGVSRSGRNTKVHAVTDR